MRFLSGFRFQQIIWNTLLVVLIYTIAAMYIFSFMKNRLESIELEKLSQQLNVVSTVIYKSGGDYNDWYHLGGKIPFLIMEDWKHRYQTEAWQQLYFPGEWVQQNFDKEALDSRTIGGQHFLLKLNTVRTGIDTMHNFQVVLAMENTSTQESIDKLATKLFSGVPFIIILALLGGYFLANRALKPVKLIRQKAQHISAQSLSERLPVINARDEIGQLTIVFNQLLNRLEQAFDQLKQFTADASHEFRTPLTSIRSTGQVALKDAREPAELKEAIGSMLEDAENLTHLVNNLLILTRNDSGKLKLDFVEVNLVEQISRGVDELHVLAEEKKIEIYFEHPESVVMTINIPSFLQAIRNVLHNAILYTPVNGLIKIRLLKNNTTDSIQIEIEDSGPGIKSELREKVFERFYRIDEARSNVQDGAGLGLAIARWAVEINKGSILFVDGPGGGATCRMEFPKI